MTMYTLTDKGRGQASKLEKSNILRAASLTRHAIFQFLKTSGAATLEEIEDAVMKHHVSVPIDSDFVMAVTSTRGGVLSISRGIARDVRLMVKSGHLTTVET